MAELVVATSSFDTYPGGVVVLRCADWLGAARGTLTTEADSRSACGTVVRDSQTVTNSIFSNEIAALGEAEDTLVIDTALLPLEINFRYYIFLSLLIEGDWDVTNTDTIRGAHQEEFQAACQTRWFMGSLGLLAATRQLDFKPRFIDSYRIVGAGTTGDITGTQVMTWRSFAQDGTTCEWLLDQIYFVPSATTSTDEWDSTDFQLVPGNWSTSGTGGIGDGFIDGADGGDDFGKFTWHPDVIDEPVLVTSSGGGDYQKDPQDEYMIRVLPDDLFLWNSVTETEANAHAYGLHGPFYVPTQVWTLDPFTRTAGDNNFAGADGHFTTQSPGDTPEGFGWLVDGVLGPFTHATSGQRRGRAVWVDGSELCFESRGSGVVNDGSMTVNLYSYGGETVQNLGATIRADNEIVSGTFHAESTVGSPAGLILRVTIATNNTILAGNPSSISIQFNLQTGAWQLYTGVAAIPLGSPQTLAGYTFGDDVAYKIEVRRYIARAKVWDAGGAEPGAWDVEEFRDLFNAVYDAYDYSDDLSFSIVEVDKHSVFIRYESTSTVGNEVIFRMDDIQIEHDAGGDNESAWASIEQPEGTEIDRIELPAGCQHFVYWGTRDWTALDAGFPWLDFSGKAWNDATAAELQRSEAVLWWFRSVHFNPTLIPMNWRSSDRSPIGQNRILSGG